MTPHARNSDPVTSHEAAARVGEFKEDQCRRIYKALFDWGPLGAEEIADLLDMDAYSVRKRLSDLEHSDDANPTDTKRKTRSGRHERIWEAL